MRESHSMERRGTEELHNDVVSLLAGRKARLETALYVLEMIKFELLLERYKQLFGPLNQPGRDSDGSAGGMRFG
jgi:hypothetical protein